MLHRSIVIHKVDGSRWTCADIKPVTICPEGCTRDTKHAPPEMHRRLLFSSVPKPEPPVCPHGCQAS